MYIGCCLIMGPHVGMVFGSNDRLFQRASVLFAGDIPRLICSVSKCSLSLCEIGLVFQTSFFEIFVYKYQSMEQI